MIQTIAISLYDNGLLYERTSSGFQLMRLSRMQGLRSLGRQSPMYASWYVSLQVCFQSSKRSRTLSTSLKSSTTSSNTRSWPDSIDSKQQINNPLKQFYNRKEHLNVRKIQTVLSFLYKYFQLYRKLIHTVCHIKYDRQ